MLDLPDTATLSCDNCGESVEVDLTEFAGEPPSVGLDELPEGWTEEGGDHHCPACSEGEE